MALKTKSAKQKVTLQDNESSSINLVKNICRFIEANQDTSSLKQLAKQFDLSPYHLQKTFKKVLGISPRQYADEIRLSRFKGALKNDTLVTTALYESGFNSMSSLYGQVTARLGMSPVHYREGAAHVAISYTTVRCPLGWLLVARTERGLCALSLGDTPHELIEWLLAEFPKAIISEDDQDSTAYITKVLQYINGNSADCDLPLDLQATAFQRRVWEELRRIPYGTTRSYGEIAKAIGQPTAARAVARACAANLTSLVIPCHRVVRGTGKLGGYRWGIERKEALLELEKLKTTSRPK